MVPAAFAHDKPFLIDDLYFYIIHLIQTFVNVYVSGAFTPYPSLYLVPQPIWDSNVPCGCYFQPKIEVLGSLRKKVFVAEMEGFGHRYFSAEKSCDPASRRRAPAFSPSLSQR